MNPTPHDYDLATVEAREHVKETGHAVSFGVGGWACTEPNSDCEACGPATEETR
jgi:hypothetical protein